CEGARSVGLLQEAVRRGEAPRERPRRRGRPVRRERSGLIGRKEPSVHVEKIVLATDFSAAARAALEHAIALCARFAARLYLFHVVDVRDSEGVHVLGNEARVDDFYELAERRAREELEQIRDRLGGAPSSIPIV